MRHYDNTAWMDDAKFEVPRPLSQRQRTVMRTLLTLVALAVVAGVLLALVQS